MVIPEFVEEFLKHLYKDQYEQIYDMFYQEFKKKKKIFIINYCLMYDYEKYGFKKHSYDEIEKFAELYVTEQKYNEDIESSWKSEYEDKKKIVHYIGYKIEETIKNGYQFTQEDIYDLFYKYDYINCFTSDLCQYLDLSFILKDDLDDIGFLLFEKIKDSEIAEQYDIVKKMKNDKSIFIQLYVKNIEKLSEVLHPTKYLNDYIANKDYESTDILIDNILKNIEHVPSKIIVSYIDYLFLNHEDKYIYRLLENDMAKKYFIQDFPRPFFDEILEQLNLPYEWIEQKNIYLSSILNGIEDEAKRKKLFTVRYFGQILNNAMLDIETIIQACDLKPHLKGGILKTAYPLLKRTYAFLKHNEEMPSFDLEDYEDLSGLIETCYRICELDFKKELSDSISVNHTGTLINEKSKYGVDVFRFENESEDERNIPMLVSTVKGIKEKTPKEFYEMYLNPAYEEKYNSRCCTLIDEHHLNDHFNSESNSIMFGYKNLTGREIISATLSDGGGGLASFRNNRYYNVFRKCRPTSLLPVSEFIKRKNNGDSDNPHNEINVNRGNTGKVLMPDYIISTKEPTEYEIEVAKLFNIPIYIFDIERYKQEDKIEDDLEYYSTGYSITI